MTKDAPLPQAIDIEALLDGMAARMPWRVASKVLAHNGAPRARGWELLREKLADQKNALNLNGLSAAFVDHVLHGEKASRFFTLDVEDLDATVRRKFASRIELKTFPFGELSKANDLATQGQPTLCFVGHEAAGTALVYTSVRASERREVVDLLELPKEARKPLERFKEIVGVTQDTFRAFDVIWVPANSATIEIRADFPSGTNAEAAGLALAKSVKAFSNDAEIEMTDAPVNLFPVIKRLYDDKDEGRIVELALHTSTGSFKHEKMRAGQKCLRTELYHVGGKGALKGAIELFKLGVRWDVEYDGEERTSPELLLNGNYRMLHSSGPSLETAVIRNCAGSEDYEFVRGKIDKFLQADAA